MYYFTKLCRLCISFKHITLTLNNTDSDNITFLNKLNEFAPEILELDNKLPLGICTTCIAELKNACNFRKKCFQSQKILKRYLKLFEDEENIQRNRQSRDETEINIENHTATVTKQVICGNKSKEELNVNEFTNVDQLQNDKFQREETIQMSRQRRDEFEINLKNNTASVTKKVICSNKSKDELNVNEFINVDQLQNDKFLREETIQSSRQRRDEIEVNLANNTASVTKQVICSNKSKDELNVNEFTNVDQLQNDKFLREETIQRSRQRLDEIEVNLANNTASVTKQVICSNKSTDELNVNVDQLQNDKFQREENAIQLEENIESVIKEEPIEYNSEIDLFDNDNESNYFDDNPKVIELKSEYGTIVIEEHNLELCDEIIDIKNEIIEEGSRRVEMDDDFSETMQIDEHNKSENNTKSDKRYVCAICNKTIKTKYSLARHMRIHSNDKCHKCEICGKGFHQKGNLQLHVRSHTKEKPFACKICGKAFTSNSNLITHGRLHTKEKPFKCEICYKVFGHSHHLKDHMRIHTKERPFVCKLCDKTYNQSGSLKVHMRKHDR